MDRLMAQLDPSIILQAGKGVVPLKDPSEIADEQAARQMRQLQLQQAQQGITDDQAYRQALQSGATGDALVKELRGRGLGKQAIEYQKFETEQQKAQGERGKLVAEGMKNGAAMILANPTEENAIQALTMAQQQYGLPQQMVDGAKAQIYAARNDPNRLKQLAVGWGGDAEKVLGKITSENLGGMVQQQRINPVTGQVDIFGQQQKTVGPDALLSAQTSRANNADTIANSSANAALADARAREFNATKVEENRLKREQKQETADMTKAGQVASFDTMLGTLDRLSTHPGLSRSVGVMSKLPTMPGSESANFQAELESFKSQAFVPMVAQLKGMGALSDAEGRKLTQAVGALDPNMGEKAFRESVKRITDDMNAARARVVGTSKDSTSASTPEKKQPLQLGMRRNGYIYKGGNPNDKSSWEPER